MKANIMILGTGGTVAGVASDAEKTVGYQSGSLSIHEILTAVPSVSKIANISSEQILNLSSRLMSPNEWLLIAKRTQELVNREDVDGVVITHGTNTLEEISYFLNLTIQTIKPIVMVGAMRPATAISADGPMNIFQAVTVASSKLAKGRGVLVVMNGKVFSARDVTKGNTTNIDAFISSNACQLGWVENGTFYLNCNTEKKHTFNSIFSIDSISTLPKVDIIYNYAGSGSEAVEAFIKSGAKGIISAGVGDGALSKKILDAFIVARQSNIAIVRSSRTGTGIVIKDGDEKDSEHGFVVSHDLTAQKARVLLMTALTKTVNMEEIQNFFYEY